MLEYAALVASPRALPDGLILVFQHPVKGEGLRASAAAMPVHRIKGFAIGAFYIFQAVLERF
jgi:hypothetical protein